MADIIQIRRDTTAAWEAANPVLYDGEFGMERTVDGSQKIKLGNGVLAWDDLPYWTFDTIDISIPFVLEGGDAEILPGPWKGVLELPFNCEIKGVKLISEDVGNIVIDIQRSTIATFPVFTSLTAAAQPTLAAAQLYIDNVLTGWTKDLAKGDLLKFVVVSASGITNMTISLMLLKK